MRKGPKVIQICGMRGILLTTFIVTCLFAGFVIFPSKMAAYLWNYVGSTYIALPQINAIQGGLLWAMTALAFYLLNNKSFAISFGQPMELSDEEMKVLMDRIKMQKQAQKLNAMIMKSNEIKIINKNIEPEKGKDLTETQKTVHDINEKKL